MLPDRLLPALRALRLRGAQCPASRSRVTNAAVDADDRNRVKPYSEIPGPRGHSFVRQLKMLWAYLPNRARPHEILLKMHEEYGPVFKHTFGSFEMVFVVDIPAIQEVFRLEGKYPERMPFLLMAEQRRVGNHATGVFLSEGEEWLRQRRVVNQHMMKIRTVESHTDDFSKVADDFLQRLLTVRSPDSLAVPQLDNELFNWSLESACTFLLEQRLGCLSEARNPRAQEVIDAVHVLTECLGDLFIYPPKFVRIFFPGTWKKFCESSEVVWDYAHERIKDRLQQLKARPTPEGESVGFLEYLLSHPDLTQETAMSNLTEFLQAAIDTTSNTFLFIVYELARHPEVQQKLYEEVTKVVPPGSDLKASDLQNVPYLKAVIKETMRLYPITSGFTRILAEDGVVMGYHIPKKTVLNVSVYTMGRMESIYPEAEAFRPERWLRDGTSPRSTDDKAKAIAHLPFGFGPRMCVDGVSFPHRPSDSPDRPYAHESQAAVHPQTSSGGSSSGPLDGTKQALLSLSHRQSSDFDSFGKPPPESVFSVKQTHSGFRKKTLQV